MLSPLVSGVALGVVALAALFLVALASAALLAPSRTEAFLMAFATTRGKHYLEVAIRILVGGAFVITAPRMAFEAVFSAFGWVLVATSAALCLVPWHIHRRFAGSAVPRAVRYLPQLGLASLAGGVFVIIALIRGSPA